MTGIRGKGGLLILVISGSLLGFGGRAEERPPEPRGAAFEYTILKTRDDVAASNREAKVLEELNQLGKGGWELVSSHLGQPSIFIFKRPK